MTRWFINLRVDERNTHGVVSDERAQAPPDVRQLHQQRLHDVVAGDQALFPRPIYDVRCPDERHPIFWHWAFSIHLFENFPLALQHKTWKRKHDTLEMFRFFDAWHTVLSCSETKNMRNWHTIKKNCFNVRDLLFWMNKNIILIILFSCFWTYRSPRHVAMWGTVALLLGKPSGAWWRKLRWRISQCFFSSVDLSRPVTKSRALWHLCLWYCLSKQLQ